MVAFRNYANTSKRSYKELSVTVTINLNNFLDKDGCYVVRDAVQCCINLEKFLINVRKFLPDYTGSHSRVTLDKAVKTMPPTGTEHRFSSSISRPLATKLTELPRTNFSVKSGATNPCIRTIIRAQNKQRVKFLTKDGLPEIKTWYIPNMSQLNRRCLRSPFLKLHGVHLI